MFSAFIAPYTVATRTINKYLRVLNIRHVVSCLFSPWFCFAACGHCGTFHCLFLQQSALRSQHHKQAQNTHLHICTAQLCVCVCADFLRVLPKAPPSSSPSLCFAFALRSIAAAILIELRHAAVAFELHALLTPLCPLQTVPVP